MSVAPPLVRSFASRYGGAINWFPGHMYKTTTQLADKIKVTDVIIEVRDARVPFSSANPILESLSASRRRIVVFNKADLASEQLQPRVRSVLERQGLDCIYTTASRGVNVAKLMTMTDKYPSKADGFRTAGKTMLILGLPNTGKSSLINALRASANFMGRKGAKTGASPGITRSVGTFQIRENPPLFVFDSPGVMLPRIDHVEIGLRLTVANTLPTTLVPWPVQAEYLLYFFNTIGSTRFVDAMGLSKPYTEESVEAMLDELATKLRLLTVGGLLDHAAAARHFVRAYQSGEFGKYVLDPIP